MNEFNIDFLLDIKINIHVYLPHTKKEKIFKGKRTRKTGVTSPEDAWSSVGVEGVVTDFLFFFF